MPALRYVPSMSFSATRLTCFALLAALEEDMRATIEACLGDSSIGEVVPSDRADRAQERRKKEGLAEAASLAALLPFLDFGDSYELLMSQKARLVPGLAGALQRIGPAVPRLIAIRNRVAHTRPMEIDDSAHLFDIARELFDSTPGVWQTLGETLARLTADPSYVLGLTITLRADAQTGPQHNLPIPDFDETGFFGRQSELRRIKKAIKGAYPVVSILGDGGIGKTSLALKAAYELLEEPDQPFEVFVWVTAKATILTPNEIQRISGAIESSLGLFAQAATELGGAPDRPIEEVLEYLATFRVLLLLDNLETVLDNRLREFLLDLPLGSKVIITSRIGLGIENPVRLEPLTVDDSVRLLRTLARVRGVRQLKELAQEDVEALAGRMSGHPAYIRWFVAGVQAGRRPEELVGDNALLLDFCMSNVYEYLNEDARAAVRSMQVLPGARNQAELAFLNDFDAGRIQTALLELITTNFVQMSSVPSGVLLETTYSLSDFAKQYLDKHHPVAQDERDWLLGRSQELVELGSRLTAANSASPYSVETVNVRGIGDVHVARLLRDALRAVDADPALALRLCSEAQVLAPGYSEAWRVEAFVRAVGRDHAGALAAYERASELAPDSPALMYHYGSYLLNEGGDPKGGLRMLQAAAKRDAASAEIASAVSWAHYCLGDMLATIDTSRHIAGLRGASQEMREAAAVLAMRAAVRGVEEDLTQGGVGKATGLLEASVDAAESMSVELFKGEAYDRLIQLRALARSVSELADERAARTVSEQVVRLGERQRSADPDLVGREVGSLKTLRSDKGFGFVRSAAGVDFFFHYRDLFDAHDWDRLVEGVPCAFMPRRSTPRGPRAERVRVLAWD